MTAIGDATSSYYPENNEGGNNKEDNTVQCGVSSGCYLQQAEAIFDTASDTTVHNGVITETIRNIPAEHFIATTVLSADDNVSCTTSAIPTIAGSMNDVIPSTVSAESSAVRSSETLTSNSCVSFSVQRVDLLDVTLLYEDAELINNLLNDFREFAKTTCENMVTNYVSTTVVSGKFSPIGKAIWCKTYRELHKSSFISSCLYVYHVEYRSGFIRTLTSVQVVSSFSGGIVLLTGSRLLDFLLRLDCAILEVANSTFNSEWDEVAERIFSELEDGSLDAISCEDFINVLDIVGVPPVAISGSKTRAKGKDKGKTSISSSEGIASGSIKEPTHNSLPFHRSLLLQFQPELSSYPYHQSGPQLSSLSPLIKADILPSKFIKLSYDGVSSSGSPAVNGQIVSSNGFVSATVTSSAMLDFSLCVPLPVKHVVLLGVTLLPDDAEIINKLFRDFRVFVKRACVGMVTRYLSMIVSGELSTIGKDIWCKTYRKLHESNFMSRCICIYHAKYRPGFIRTLTNVKLLSVSSDRLVLLMGSKLLDFLLRLDCTILEIVSSIFNSEWCEVAERVFSKMEDGSLDAVSCKDFVNVLEVAGVPAVAISGYQRHMKYVSESSAPAAKKDFPMDRNDSSLNYLRGPKKSFISRFLGMVGPSSLLSVANVSTTTFSSKYDLSANESSLAPTAEKELPIGRSSSSLSYLRGPKKSFMSRFNIVGCSSSVSAGSNAVVSIAAEDEGDVRERLAVSLNCGSLPDGKSSGSMMEDSVGVSSSHCGSSKRIRGRKRKN